MIEDEVNSESSSEMREARLRRRDSFRNEGANNTKVKVRLNLVLRGDVARILIELKSRGIARSYADCINQSILLFYAKIMERDLLSTRLKAFERGCNDDFKGEE